MTVETTPAGAPPDASAVVSPPAAVPPPLTTEQTPAPSAAAPATQEKTEPGMPEAAANEQNSGQGENDEQNKPKKRFQERIDQLRSEVRAANDEAAALRAQLDRLREPMRVPDRELSFEEQDALRLRQVVREDRAEQIEAEAISKRNEAVAKRTEMFLAKAEAASDRMPDLLEKFAAVPCSHFASDFIAESDRAAELAYYLGSNPHEAMRLASLPDTRQAIELTRLEARLQAAPQVRRISQAPTPPPTVGGGTAPLPKQPAEMSLDEYAQWYEARQQKARR